MLRNIMFQSFIFRSFFGIAALFLLEQAFFMGGLMTDRDYMKRAIDLALRGTGHVNPNPLVGAVIVKDGRIIGEGYHASYGALHAERDALAKCTEDCSGATMYVTLEPCCHYGKQPPCTDAIIASGITRCIVGSPDPNPKVSGHGIEILRQAGIEVITEFMREECDAINRPFLHFIQTGRPYIVMKYAMTADGKIATRTRESRWITGEIARKRVHEDRNKYAAIMVGVGTVIADDPLLTCRIEGGKNPMRIICDTNLRIPLDSQVVKTADQAITVIATCSKNEEKIDALVDEGCWILNVPEKDGHINLNELVKCIGEMNLDSIYIEGGGTLNWSALEAGIVDTLNIYIAPKILGGKEAPSPVDGLGCEIPDGGFGLSSPKITILGGDILLESEVIKCL